MLNGPVFFFIVFEIDTCPLSFVSLSKEKKTIDS